MNEAFRIETGIRSRGQEENATAQCAPYWEVVYSIATRIDVPEAVAALGEAAIAGYLRERLEPLTQHGLRFHVQVGPA